MPLTAALQGSPYLIGEDPSFTKRAERSLERAAAINAKAILAQSTLERDARDAIGAFEMALRSDLVTESNLIEGNQWEISDARALVAKHRDELLSPSRQFLEAVRSDDHTYQVIGLYAAHQLAEQLAKTEGTLREVDIRQLHSVIVGSAHYAGRYKSTKNEIGGTTHLRAAPWDVPRVMHDMCSWWESSEADPIVQAAVVHAWVSDIHPFEDGNGRVSRILANFCLVKAGYPPLMLRAQSDRSQYFDALALSDDGDILPLLELFVQSLRRTVKTMNSPDYIQQVIDDKLLAQDAERFQLWSLLKDSFFRAVAVNLNEAGLELAYQGSPTLEGFKLLTDHDADGNCWFFKAGSASRWDILAWFGFESAKMLEFDLDGVYPTIFFSTRDHSEQAVHPYRPIGNYDFYGLPHEIRLRPGSPKPVQLRWDREFEAYSLHDGVARVTGPLARALGG